MLFISTSPAPTSLFSQPTPSVKVVCFVPMWDGSALDQRAPNPIPIPGKCRALALPLATHRTLLKPPSHRLPSHCSPGPHVPVPEPRQLGWWGARSPSSQAPPSSTKRGKGLLEHVVTAGLRLAQTESISESKREE